MNFKVSIESFEPDVQFNKSVADDDFHLFGSDIVEGVDFASKVPEFNNVFGVYTWFGNNADAGNKRLETSSEMGRRFNSKIPHCAGIERE